ncbi:MAG: hypothetical protein M1828_005574 [Chrysothrix sp. TS-e1954]|nr:MAG: hypothetical protein M1828_005574 [Chrysothrix sp. TS-e1954]
MPCSSPASDSGQQGLPEGCVSVSSTTDTAELQALPAELVQEILIVHLRSIFNPGTFHYHASPHHNEIRAPSSQRRLLSRCLSEGQEHPQAKVDRLDSPCTQECEKRCRYSHRYGDKLVQGLVNVAQVSKFLRCALLSAATQYYEHELFTWWCSVAEQWQAAHRQWHDAQVTARVHIFQSDEEFSSCIKELHSLGDQQCQAYHSMIGARSVLASFYVTVCQIWGEGVVRGWSQKHVALPAVSRRATRVQEAVRSTNKPMTDFLTRAEAELERECEAIRTLLEPDDWWDEHIGRQLYVMRGY